MQDIQFNNKANIILRMGLESWFHDTVGKAMKDIDCKYFNHQLIQNYSKEDQTISSFCTYPKWQQEYWQNYWDGDPLLHASYEMTSRNGSAISPWNCVDPTSDVMEKRKAACNLGSGFSFWMHHNSGILEFFSFGWTKYDVNKVTRQRLAKLHNMLTDFKIQHYRLNRDMFNNGYPSVDFEKEE